MWRTLLMFNSDISLMEIARTSETFLSANLIIPLLKISCFTRFTHSVQNYFYISELCIKKLDQTYISILVPVFMWLWKLTPYRSISTELIGTTILNKSHHKRKYIDNAKNCLKYNFARTLAFCLYRYEESDLIDTVGNTREENK
jgi:hypothetical protein